MSSQSSSKEASKPAVVMPENPSAEGQKVKSSPKDLQQPSNEPQPQPTDVASLMGFAAFGTTKQKKVQGKGSGGKRVEKTTTKTSRKYRQYVNRKSKKLIQ
ncbi:LAQU0S05e04324g1_1 [Lachancea quebecensis]|uniref:LAQU0S05e04324g1_1 n=1 Tax=Lachancea quebecensis TaxID=1654605 RepID=A0A0N7MLI6_9SACH|nr:LAQU0S05e04324g1_1 [Lachancea quebecensis]